MMTIDQLASYVRRAKVHFGDAHMSDRELGQRLGGFSTSRISDARYGNMTDGVAVAIATVLKIEPGEVLLLARAERERDEVVKEHLLRYMGKALRAVPSRAASVLAALAVALSAWLAPEPAYAAAGGDGRIRRPR